MADSSGVDGPKNPHCIFTDKMTYSNCNGRRVKGSKQRGLHVLQPNVTGPERNYSEEEGQQTTRSSPFLQYEMINAKILSIIGQNATAKIDKAE